MSTVRNTDWGWFRPFLIRTITIVFVVGILALAVFGLRVLLLLFAGLLFGVFLGRLSQYVTRFIRIPRLISLFLILSVFLGLIAVAAPLVSSQAGYHVNRLVEQINGALDLIAEWMREMGWTEVDLLQKLPLAGAVEGSLYTVVELVSGIVVIFFVGIYFAIHPDIYRRGLVSLFPVDRRERTSELIGRAEDALWRWLVGRSLIMLTTGLLVSLGLWCAGCPLPVTLGLLAGLLAFVPTLGPVIAMAPALLVAIGQGWETVIWVSVIYVLIQAAEANLLTPVVDHFQVSVPPVLLLGSQLLMGLFAGALGIAVASPLCAISLLLIKELYVKDVLGDEGENRGRWSGVNRILVPSSPPTRCRRQTPV